MGKDTKIEWAHHTFNPWIGCSKVSEGCANCYAETKAKQLGVVWGPGAKRKRTTPKNWAQPLRWNAEAKAYGERYRVFTASLADIFDHEVPDAWREDLFELIAETPYLDWLIVTKRPDEMQDWFTAHGDAPDNVWLGVSVENQEQAEARIPVLLEIPAVVRFLSMEPLLGPVDLDLPRCPFHQRDYAQSYPIYGEICAECARDGDTGEMPYGMWLDPCASRSDPGINWVIVGGESGEGARPMDPIWMRNIRNDCVAHDVAFLFKQWGEWAPSGLVDGDTECETIDMENGTVMCRIGKLVASNDDFGQRYLAFPDPVRDV